MSILNYQENIDALWEYWFEELHNTKRWQNNHEGWIRCHPEEDIAARKGSTRMMRKEKKRREKLIGDAKKRVLYCEAMLREITHEVDLENENLLSAH